MFHRISNNRDLSILDDSNIDPMMCIPMYRTNEHYDDTFECHDVFLTPWPEQVVSERHDETVDRSMQVLF
jgi:hypothetical protein